MDITLIFVLQCDFLILGVMKYFFLSGPKTPSNGATLAKALQVAQIYVFYGFVRLKENIYTKNQVMDVY